jgi:hypothetical protein
VFGRDVEPRIQTGKRHTVAEVERDDLGEQNPRLLDEVVAGLAGDPDVQRTQVVGEEAGKGLDVEWLLRRLVGNAESPSRVDLFDRMTGVREPPGHRRGAFDRELERGKRVREHSPTDV